MTDIQRRAATAGSEAERRRLVDEVKAESRAVVAMIAEGLDIRTISQLADRQEAVRLVVRKAGIGLEAQNAAAYGRLRLEREGGRLLRQMAEAGERAARGDRGRTDKNRQRDGSNAPTLVDLGVADDPVTADNRARRWQKIAEPDDATFEQYVEAVDARGEELTQAGVRALANRIAGGKGVVQSVTNEWYTPTIYLDAARAVLGSIDLDPASCAQANETVQARRYFTEDDDGLDQEWTGRVWLNPPYGRIAGDFIARLVDEHLAGRVPAAVTLVNAHCTDTRWFQPLWDYTLCFTDHRIDFAAGTTDRSGSTHGSVFVYLGSEHSLFAKTFDQFGAVVRRYA